MMLYTHGSRHGLLPFASSEAFKLQSIIENRCAMIFISGSRLREDDRESLCDDYLERSCCAQGGDSRVRNTA